MTLDYDADRRILIGLLALLALLVFRHADATEDPPPRQPALAEAAAKLERDGRKVEAIAVYEQLARQDPLSERLVAQRLARLYAATGNTNAAIAWATKATKKHPDPEAYLAGVHALCGNHAEAAQILTKALEAQSIPRLREIILRWQLADSLVARKKQPEAEAQLRKALALAEGNPEEPTARKRLRALVGSGR